MEIRYLKHHQIDKEKWDSAIENAQNGLVYTLSWYLDIVSPEWESLILGDYELIMPLTQKRKFGIQYIIQPPFCQQLGVFYINNQEIKLEDFFNKIPRKYKKLHIQINSGITSNLKLNKRSNYELSLNKSLEDIQKGFNNNTLRNINKAEKYKLKIETNITPKNIWVFKKSNPVNNLSEWHYDKLISLMETVNKKSMGETYAVYNNVDQLIAAAFLIIYKNRITLLVSTSNQEGKEKSAMFLIIHEIIKKYKEKDLILDFEGGNISGLARFFSGFGAKPVSYYIYTENRLTWPLKKLM